LAHEEETEHHAECRGHSIHTDIAGAVKRTDFMRSLLTLLPLWPHEFLQRVSGV
jgi:hypothetical protein